jgi:hypothetical protein
MNMPSLRSEASGTLTNRLCSMLMTILVTACSNGGNQAGAESKSCTERLGGEILFVGEARCLAALPQEKLSGFWVSGHEYSVFYNNKEDIQLEPDAQAAWLFLSSEAEVRVEHKMRAGEWQVFAISFVGVKSTARGIYGPGPFEAGVLVTRILKIDEVTDQ